MKLPKTVIISGKTWKIKENKNLSGGNFRGSQFTIEVGTKYKQDVIDIFLHEVIEAILCEHNCRLNRYTLEQTKGTENFLFVFDHEQFRQLISNIAFAIKDIVKE